ncbi:MAG: hypothetical protein AAGJ18_06590 [Bacteroidota bacterium]
MKKLTIICLYLFVVCAVTAQEALDSCHWLKTDAAWYYRPWVAEYQEKVTKVAVVGDTIINNRVCALLGVFEQDTLVENSQLIVFYDLENKQVFFYEFGQFKLLYDFSFLAPPEDTTTFFVPQNSNAYDISSSKSLVILPEDNPYSLIVFSYDTIAAEDSSLVINIMIPARME